MGIALIIVLGVLGAIHRICISCERCDEHATGLVKRKLEHKERLQELEIQREHNLLTTG